MVRYRCSKSFNYHDQLHPGTKLGVVEKRQEYGKILMNAKRKLVWQGKPSISFPPAPLCTFTLRRFLWTSTRSEKLPYGRDDILPHSFATLPVKLLFPVREDCLLLLLRSVRDKIIYGSLSLCFCSRSN